MLCGKGDIEILALILMTLMFAAVLVLVAGRPSANLRAEVVGEVSEAVMNDTNTILII